jgi:hypothetical protein
MDRKVPINDATISRNVIRQLASFKRPCRIQVQTRNGEVTLSGTVQFVHQRNAAVQAIRTVEGVTRVVEKLKVMPAAKHTYQQPASMPKKEVGVGEPQAASDDAATDTPLPLSASGKEPSRVHIAEAAARSTMTNEGSDELSFDMDSPPEAGPVAPFGGSGQVRFTRSGDSYTFECSTSEEAERLRVLLASFADWLQKNSWVGQSKHDGELHRVTFHAKSLIEFLRQQGF